MRFISGTMIGAGMMYLLDPDKAGKRRRVLARDKAVRAEHVAGRFADKSIRDLQNRALGIVHEARAAFREQQVPDEKLEQRVRAKLGRALSHPHAIAVQAHDGVVKLYGPILQDEVQDLLDAVRSVRGVRAIENCLEPHETADGVPDLQGRSQRRERRRALLYENWAPSVRAVVGLAGAALLLASRQSRALRVPAAAVGGAALFRAITNMPFRRALGLARTARVSVLQKTVNINAPVEELYQLFSNPENFSRIFEHVEDVRHSRDNLYHWTVRGPGGISVSWEAMLTDAIANKLIAWRSVPDAAVSTAGFIKFQPNQNGGTAVHIQFAYNPPGGIIGHVFASLFGADPKHALEDDMARLKALFEIGKTRVHHHRITREELEHQISSARSEFRPPETSISIRRKSREAS